MALSIPNRAHFTNSVDVPKKTVPVDKMNMSILNVSTSPAGVQSGIDDSKALLVFIPDDAAQPLDESSKIIVNFGPGATGITNRDAAYAAVLSAGTAV